MLAIQQVVGAIGVATFHITLVVDIGVPYVVPQDVVVTTVVTWIVCIGLGGIARVGPAEARECKGAIEAWVAAHKRYLSIVGGVGGLEQCVGVAGGRTFAISHWEHVDDHR